MHAGKDNKTSLLSEGRGTSLSELDSLLTLLVHTLGQQLRVLVCGILGGFSASALECDSVSLVLQALRSDESLNLGGLGVWLGAFLLGDHFTSNDELAIERNRIWLVSGRSIFKGYVRKEFLHTEHHLAWSNQRIVGSWWHAWDQVSWG